MSALSSPDSSLSYEKLVRVASSFMFPQLTETECISTTYMDEDEDKITISSDEELCGAFNQSCFGKPLRIKVVIKRAMMYHRPIVVSPSEVKTIVVTEAEWPSPSQDESLWNRKRRRQLLDNQRRSRSCANSLKQYVREAFEDLYNRCQESGEIEHLAQANMSGPADLRMNLQ